MVSQLSLDVPWSEWLPLQDAGRGSSGIPALPGLYRIRSNDVLSGRLDYIGQTGRTLRERLGSLRGIWAEEMPYADPHTAAPALWALRRICEERGDIPTFEVSVAVVTEGDYRWRLGLECVALALYRQEHDASPTVNFGRMPAGYRKSSGNSARLVAAGKRFRGGPCDAADSTHLSGIAPPGPLGDDIASTHWCGHHWTGWCAAPKAAIPPDKVGLYRLRRSSIPNRLVYVGQGQIASRVASHLVKSTRSGHPQSLHFGPPDLEVSWTTYGVNDDWNKCQREELENDLIAAHILATHAVPDAQFLGDG